MKIWVVAVGQRVPPWAQTAWEDFSKRFSADTRPVLKAVKTEPRTNNQNIDSVLNAEKTRIQAVLPRGCQIIALDERGSPVTTQQLAQNLESWRLSGQDVAFLIGGPDGLDPQLKLSAHQKIKLSDLTLPHAMVRVLLIEQLYRAHSLLANHPYHRE